MDMKQTLAAVRAAILLRAKAEIIMDALGGRFAARPGQGKDGEIRSYSDLHDYVDANKYGGAFDEDVTNMLQDLVYVPPATLAEAEDPGEFAADRFLEVTSQFYDPLQQDADVWITEGGLTDAVERATTDPAFQAAVRALAAGLPVAGVEIEL